MEHIPTEILELRHKYIKKYNKLPAPFNFEEWDSFEQYKEYLEKELDK